MIIRVRTIVSRGWTHENRAHGAMVRGDPDNKMKGTLDSQTLPV